MTVLDGYDRGVVERFVALLLSMSYDDPEVRPLLKLEGLKEWRVGRTSGYAPLEAAVDRLGLYSPEGAVIDPDYRRILGA